MSKKVKKLSPELYSALKSEITASKIMFPPDDAQKKYWNEAMDKCLEIIKSYKEGNGIYQQSK